MIFEALHASAQRGELLLVDGGYCRWHLRKDGQLTILEIISTRPGAGSEMLATLQSKNARVLVARCPVDLVESNEWYKKKGFKLLRLECGRTGRYVNVWQYQP